MILSKNGKAPTTPVSRLGQVKRGRVTAGTRFCFYGVESVGKSTLAAHAPNPIFVDAEGGTNFLDVPRYTFGEQQETTPATFADVISAITDLTVNKHDYQTLVLDTIDRIEALIWNHCLARDSNRQSNLNQKGKKLESIESYGFGKGYVVALDEWRNLARYLDRLRTARGMHVVLLGHCLIRTFKNPEGEDYDRYQLNLRDNAAGFIKEWSDVVGFCQYEEFGGKLNDGDTRAKGTSTGRRLMQLTRTAAYDAKSRLALPESLELAAINPWAPLDDAIRRSTDPNAIGAAIAAELVRLGDSALTKNVNLAVKKHAENPATLSRYLGDLKGRMPKEEANV